MNSIVGVVPPDCERQPLNSRQQLSISSANCLHSLLEVEFSDSELMIAATRGKVEVLVERLASGLGKCHSSAPFAGLARSGCKATSAGTRLMREARR